MIEQPTVTRSWLRLVRTYADALAVARAVLVEEKDEREIDRYAMLLLFKIRRKDGD